MCLATNIARRAGSASYYARLGVPLDLQPILGRRELWKSLGTKDAREAKARIGAVLARWHDEFAELRRRAEARPATPDDLQAETWEHYQGELDRHHGERRTLPTAADVEAAEAQGRAAIEAAKPKVREEIARGVPAAEAKLAFVSAGADAMLTIGRRELSRDMRARQGRAGKACPARRVRACG